MNQFPLFHLEDANKYFLFSWRAYEEDECWRTVGDVMLEESGIKMDRYDKDMEVLEVSEESLRATSISIRDSVVI